MKIKELKYIYQMKSILNMVVKKMRENILSQDILSHFLVNNIYY